MATDNPSIVFVPGGLHTEFHLRDVTQSLAKLNYNVVPVVLRTSTKSDPPPELQDNVNAILDALRSETASGKPVVLLAHSVAGHSAVLAANEFLASSASPPQKRLLVHLVFVASFLDSLRLAPHLTWAKVIDDGLWTGVDHPESVFYNDLSPDQAKPFVDALAANRAQWPPPFGDKFKSLPGTYFLCTRDNAIPPHIQRLEAAETGMRTVELETGHVPFISRPEEFAASLQKALNAS